jgi:hypothetical protein
MPTALGPTLPELLHDRRGIRPRRTTIAFVGLVVLVAATVLIVQRVRRPDQLLHRGAPTFNLVYRGPVRAATPRPGELARLVANRPRVGWVLTVRPLHLNPYAGDAGHALLPILGDRQARELRRTNPGFGLRDEGRAQISGFPGYQVGFVAGAPGHQVQGRDILLIPADRGSRLGVVISYRQTSAKRVLGQRDLDVAKLVKKAVRSFNFGTARA